MLAPEVWNFDPPPFTSCTKFCESENDIFKQINHQYFNHHVNITFPNTMKLPNDIINTLLEDNQYYRIDKVSADEFVMKDFLNFLKSGQLTAISLNEFSEENSFVITPCGKFILSLTKSTFQELGIEGTFTKHSKSSLRKYIIVLDLIGDSEKFEKVQNKLSSCGNLNFDVALSWEPNDLKVCPSSIAYYFSKKGYSTKVCNIIFKHDLKYNVEVPIFNEESDIDEFTEWLGAFSLKCDMSDTNQFSTLRCPEKHETFGQVLHLTFSGLITNSRLKKVISEIDKYVNENQPLTWISFTVQGFCDSILSVRNKNLFLSEGEQHCVLIFRWNQPCVVYRLQERRS